MGGFDTSEEKDIPKKRTGVFDLQEPTKDQAQSSGSQAHTIEIHRPTWREGESVIARIKMSRTDDEWVLNQLLNAASRSKRAIPWSRQLQILDDARLQRLIISWTFTRDGQPFLLEPNRAKAIAELPQAEKDYIYQQIMLTLPNKEMRYGLSTPKPDRLLQEALNNRAKRFAKNAQ